MSSRSRSKSRSRRNNRSRIICQRKHTSKSRSMLEKIRRKIIHVNVEVGSGKWNMGSGKSEVEW